MSCRPTSAFLKSSFNYAICGESFAFLFYESQNELAGGLILTSMVGSLMILIFRSFIVALWVTCVKRTKELGRR